MPSLRDICWSHTMNILSSLLTFVRRNSVPKVTLRNTCSDMKMWSRIFAMNVQKVSIEHLNWKGINQFTLTTDSFAVSCATHSSSVNTRSKDTWRSVLQYTISAPFCFDYEQSGWSTTDYISWPKFSIVFVSSCAVRLARRSQNAWARHVERVESCRVETSRAPFCFDYEQPGWSTTDYISWPKFSIVFGCLLTVLQSNICTRNLRIFYA